MKNLSCAFTGHRPDRFSFGYNENDERCVTIKALMSEWISAFITGGVRTFYTGMALGVDQWAASIVLDMKQQHSGARLIAVLPCETQSNSWSVEQRERYFNTLAECDEVITLHTHYTRSCMFERNRRLVDSAAYLLAVYDGGAKGGTAYTVGYAKQKQRQITIIHPDTLAVDSATDIETLRHVSGCAMMLWWMHRKQGHIFYFCLLVRQSSQRAIKPPAIIIGLLPIRRLPAMVTMILLSGHKVER